MCYRIITLENAWKIKLCTVWGKLEGQLHSLHCIQCNLGVGWKCPQGKGLFFPLTQMPQPAQCIRTSARNLAGGSTHISV